MNMYTPTSDAEQICSWAKKAREAYKRGKLDVIDYLEFLQREGACFVVILPDDEMELEKAYTHIKHKIICIAESVYIDAFNDDPQARFIIAHEIGHIILHSNKEKVAIHDKMEDEANLFATELLIPSEWIIREMRRRVIKIIGADYIAQKFGVEENIAKEQLKTVRSRLGIHGLW